MQTYYELKDNKIINVMVFDEPTPIYDEEGKIIGYDDVVNDYIRNNYLCTDEEIVQLVDGTFAFADEVNLEEEAKRKAEKEFTEAKQAKLTEVDTWTASKITGGFVSTCYNGKNILYDTDTETQLTMTKARANCEGERFAQAFPNGMGVRGYAQTGTDADGTMVFANTKTVYNFLPEHIIAWDEDFSLHLAKCKYEGWIMQAEVNNATTKEELESIVLE